MTIANHAASGLVSVITPCYNAAEFVGETIESVRAQTYAPIEHIVVDDASTDGSWDVICRHGPAVRRVRLERNGGGARARNHGARLARGEYLMFLDADDLLAPETIAALVHALRDRPPSLAAAPWQRLRRSAGGWAPAPAEAPFPPPPDALDGWLRGTWVPPCAVLWHRDAYERTGGWNEAVVVNQDGELTMRALALGLPLVTSAGGLASYRAHGPSGSSVSAATFTARWFESQFLVLDRVREQLEACGRLVAYAPVIGRTYAHLARLGHLCGLREVARHGFDRAVRIGGAEAVSGSGPGRLLARMLGAYRREVLLAAFSRVGITTAARRRFLDSHAGLLGSTRAGAAGHELRT